MTLDKLATITQDEFVAVRKDMAGEFVAVRREMKNGFISVRKDMADEFVAVREEMHEMKKDIIEEVGQKIIQSNDKLATKLDLLLKDGSAHDSLHHEITDQILDHETRLRKAEIKLAK